MHQSLLVQLSLHDGFLPPVAGQSTWPHPFWRLTVPHSSHDFYSAPLSNSSGCLTRIDATLPRRISLRDLQPIEKHGSRVPDVFWFMLLQSHYIQQSNHSDETGFSSLKTLTQWSWQGEIELRCHPQIIGKQHWVFLLWVAPHKHTLFIQGPLLAPHKGGQRMERLAYRANEKQLGQLPNLNQACELNKAHCIDLGVIHYLLWMYRKFPGKWFCRAAHTLK